MYHGDFFLRKQNDKLKSQTLPTFSYQICFTPLGVMENLTLSQYNIVANEKFKSGLYRVAMLDM